MYLTGSYQCMQNQTDNTRLLVLQAKLACGTDMEKENPSNPISSPWSEQQHRQATKEIDYICSCAVVDVDLQVGVHGGVDVHVEKDRGLEVPGDADVDGHAHGEADEDACVGARKDADMGTDVNETILVDADVCTTFNADKLRAVRQ